MHDTESITRALVNLIDNAMEASSSDQRVWVYATAECGEAKIQVRDEGAGMTPDVLSRAMELGFSTKTSTESMGLGLSISRDIVEELGGKLELESTPAVGTLATMTLPAIFEGASA